MGLKGPFCMLQGNCGLERILPASSDLRDRAGGAFQHKHSTPTPIMLGLPLCCFWQGSCTRQKFHWPSVSHRPRGQASPAGFLPFRQLLAPEIKAGLPVYLKYFEEASCPLQRP